MDLKIMDLCAACWLCVCDTTPWWSQGCRALQAVVLQYLEQQLVNGTVLAEQAASLCASAPVLLLIDPARCVDHAHSVLTMNLTMHTVC